MVIFLGKDTLYDKIKERKCGTGIPNSGENGITLMADYARIGKLLLIIILLLADASCSGLRTGDKSAPGVYHRVKKGETLHTLAQVYKVNPQSIAEANHLDPRTIIETGQVLFIPRARQVAEESPAAGKEKAGEGKGLKKIEKRPIVSKGDTVPPPKSVSEAKTEARAKERPPAGKGKVKPQPERERTALSAAENETPFFPPTLPPDLRRKKEDDSSAREEQRKTGNGQKLFIWPVAGNVISRFGAQPNGMFFNGIKIMAKEGLPVVAAGDGLVIFSDFLKDYGETIILKHDEAYSTVYTSLGERLVKRNDRLKKGDTIAALPKADAQGKTVMYFEIRYKNQARNPLLYLP